MAISPELPEHSRSTSQKNHLGFDVLSDVGNRVARQFGLVFRLPEGLRRVYERFGNDLPARNGDGSYELPIPGTFVIARDGAIRLAFVDPDSTRRLEPAEILEALRRP